MTLNDLEWPFCVKICFGLAGWRLRLSDKTVRTFAELPIYCQRQKCSPGNVVSGSIRFMQIFAVVRWKGGVNWKWRFSLHSFTVFRTFYTHGHTTAFRWYDCQWPWAYFKVIGLFHITFLKNGVWYGKSYYRQLIGNHTLAIDWCHFWWPWSTLEGHFSLGCHFHVHFSYPWHAFASHGLPAIAELLIFVKRCVFSHWRNADNDSADVTSAGRSFQIRGTTWLPLTVMVTYIAYRDSSCTHCRHSL